MIIVRKRTSKVFQTHHNRYRNSTKFHKFKWWFYVDSSFFSISALFDWVFYVDSPKTWVFTLLLKLVLLYFCGKPLLFLLCSSGHLKFPMGQWPVRRANKQSKNANSYSYVRGTLYTTDKRARHTLEVTH